MLTDQEKQEIEAATAPYASKKTAGIDALTLLQKGRGWISDDLLCEVADLLDMTPAELDSVATFYNHLLRKPVGRHVIFICDSVSCWIMGYLDLRAHLEERLGITLGETTDDGRFTLLPHVCLGACDRAPVMMIDDEIFDFLDAEKIDAILSSFK